VVRLFCSRLFSHPLLLGIGYFFHGFADIIGYEELGIWFYLFLSYLIGELECR